MINEEIHQIARHVFGNTDSVFWWKLKMIKMAKEDKSFDLDEND